MKGAMFLIDRSAAAVVVIVRPMVVDCGQQPQLSVSILPSPRFVQQRLDDDLVCFLRFSAWVRRLDTEHGNTSKYIGSTLAQPRAS